VADFAALAALFSIRQLLLASPLLRSFVRDED
jgi:hypothetical protein